MYIMYFNFKLSNSNAKHKIRITTILDHMMRVNSKIGIFEVKLLHFFENFADIQNI